MYRLIISYDNGELETIEGETKPEVFKKAEKVNFEEALWELKWIPSKAIVTEAMVRSVALQGEKE